jgi:hypothetical protein
MEYTDLLNRAAVEKDPYVKLALAGEPHTGFLQPLSLCQAWVPGSGFWLSVPRFGLRV